MTSKPKILTREQEREITLRACDLEGQAWGILNEVVTEKEIEEIRTVLHIKPGRVYKNKVTRLKVMDWVYENWADRLDLARFFGVWGQAMQARWELASGCFLLAWRLGHQYARHRKHFSPEDGQQEAVFGLLDAARRFDPDRGVRFSTHARWWIKARLVRYVNEKDYLIHVPVNVLEIFRKAYNMINGHGFSLEEASEMLGKPPERIIFCMQQVFANNSMESLHVPVVNESESGDNSPRTLECILPDGKRSLDDIVLDRILLENIRDFLDQLSPRQRDCFISRVEGQTFAEIGDRYGISRERARQIVKLTRESIVAMADR